ncbi:tryptophan 2,3- dioxygenase [Sorochytrium milnesiophthora]
MALGNLGEPAQSEQVARLDPADEAILRAYDISPETGFLPEQEPLRRLPHAYYAPWEEIVDSLSPMMMNGLLRAHVEESLPVLSLEHLASDAEWRRAFFVLALISHGFIWGKHASGPARSGKDANADDGGGDNDEDDDDDNAVRNMLPKQLALPFAATARHLGLRPVVCYAAVDLWNWRRVFPNKPLSLRNMTTLHTFSGTMDEQWFYLIPNAIELEGASALTGMVQSWRWMKDSLALDSTRSVGVKLPSLCNITHSLQRLGVTINNCTRVLHRMYEHCDPYVFYNQVRPYVAGWSLVEGGVRYEGLRHGRGGTGTFPRGWVSGGGHDVDSDDSCDEHDREDGTPGAAFLFAGGSAAQSSLIQAFDAYLAITHHPTGHGPASSSSSAPPTSAAGQRPPVNFIKEMRYYMPRMHRRFLTDIERRHGLAGDMPCLRDYVQQWTELANSPAQDNSVTLAVQDLKDAYNAAVHAVRVFRDKHIQIVTRYIILQRQRQRPSVGPGSYATNSLPSSVKSLPVDAHHTSQPESASEEAKHFGKVIDIAAQPDSRTATPLTGLDEVDEDVRAAATTGTNAILKDRDIVVGEPSDEVSSSARLDEDSTARPGSNRSQSRASYSSSPSPSASSATGTPKRPKRQNSSVSLLTATNDTDPRIPGAQSDKSVKGTGGTDLIPFLKQSRDETALTKL